MIGGTDRQNDNADIADQYVTGEDKKKHNTVGRQDAIREVLHRSYGPRSS